MKGDEPNWRKGATPEEMATITAIDAALLSVRQTEKDLSRARQRLTNRASTRVFDDRARAAKKSSA